VRRFRCAATASGTADRLRDVTPPGATSNATPPAEAHPDHLRALWLQPASQDGGAVVGQARARSTLKRQGEFTRARRHCPPRHACIELPPLAWPVHSSGKRDPRGSRAPARDPPATRRRASWRRLAKTRTCGTRTAFIRADDPGAALGKHRSVTTLRNSGIVDAVSVNAVGAVSIRCHLARHRSLPPPTGIVQ
jgi:hypothetical protein